MSNADTDSWEAMSVMGMFRQLPDERAAPRLQFSDFEGVTRLSEIYLLCIAKSRSL
jgi:hypothetical protein